MAGDQRLFLRRPFRAALAWVGLMPRAAYSTVTGTGGAQPAAAAGGTRPRARDVWMFTLAAIWAGVVLAVYFRHAWVLLSGAAGRWTWPEVGQTLRYTGLPHANEALVRASAAIGAASICALAMVGLGLVAARVLAPKSASRGEWLILRAAFGAGTLGSALYALAGLGLYTPVPVRRLMLMLAAGTCVMALGRAHRARRLRLSFAATGEWPWMVITVGAVLYAGLCALAPETQFDALSYHLELPRRWLASGRPVEDLNDYVSLYPLGWDLLFGAALALDGPVAAKLLHWMALPACGAVAGLLARTVLPGASPWMAAALFVTAPTVFWEATTAYADLALALYAGVAVLALVRAHETGNHKWLLVAGVQLGFACATKHVGLVALASALPVLAWSRLRFQSNGARWTPGVRAAAEAVGVVTMLALLVPLPWYVRSWSASGNPVFPDMFRVFGAQPPQRWDALTERGLQEFKDHFGRPRTAGNVLTLPWDMTMHGARYGGTLGPMFLAGMPLMILAVVRSRRAAALASGAIIYLVLWSSPLSSYQMRFLVPLWVPCSALLAVGLQLSVETRRGRTARPVVLLALGAVLLVSLPPWTVFHEGDRRGWDGWLTHVVHEPPAAVVLGGITEDDWLRAEVQTYGAWQWINTHVPAGTRVLTFFSGDQLYAERARIWSQAVNARAATWGATSGDPERVRRELRRLGIGYVLAPADEWKTAEHRRLDLLRPGIMGPALARVYADRFTVIYAVRADAGAVAGTIDHSYGR
jgi:hypothetical protein